MRFQQKRNLIKCNLYFVRYYDYFKIPFRVYVCIQFKWIWISKMAYFIVKQNVNFQSNNLIIFLTLLLQSWTTTYHARKDSNSCLQNYADAFWFAFYAFLWFQKFTYRTFLNYKKCFTKIASPPVILSRFFSSLFLTTQLNKPCDQKRNRSLMATVTYSIMLTHSDLHFMHSYDFKNLRTVRL